MLKERISTNDDDTIASFLSINNKIMRKVCFSVKYRFSLYNWNIIYKRIQFCSFIFLLITFDPYRLVKL